MSLEYETNAIYKKLISIGENSNILYNIISSIVVVALITYLFYKASVVLRVRYTFEHLPTQLNFYFPVQCTARFDW